MKALSLLIIILSIAGYVYFSKKENQDFDAQLKMITEQIDSLDKAHNNQMKTTNRSIALLEQKIVDLKSSKKLGAEKQQQERLSFEKAKKQQREELAEAESKFNLKKGELSNKISALQNELQSQQKQLLDEIKLIKSQADNKRKDNITLLKTYITKEKDKVATLARYPRSYSGSYSNSFKVTLQRAQQDCDANIAKQSTSVKAANSEITHQENMDIERIRKKYDSSINQTKKHLSQLKKRLSKIDSNQSDEIEDIAVASNTYNPIEFERQIETTQNELYALLTKKQELDYANFIKKDDINKTRATVEKTHDKNLSIIKTSSITVGVIFSFLLIVAFFKSE